MAKMVKSFPPDKRLQYPDEWFNGKAWLLTMADLKVDKPVHIVNGLNRVRGMAQRRGLRAKTHVDRENGVGYFQVIGRMEDRDATP